MAETPQSRRVGLTTDADLNNLINLIKGYAAANRAGSTVALRRCLRQLGHALNAGQAARRICLTTAYQYFQMLRAAVDERRARPK